MYDCIIIGGGIGGLALAIQLADLQWNVLVIEKETYPYHKVCGEYLSNESIHFLERLGLSLTDNDVPAIHNLLLSSVSGITIRRPLDIGGRGVSRFMLDKLLADLAARKNAALLTGTKAEKVQLSNDVFTVHAAGRVYEARSVCGCFGRQSNLDVQLNRKYRAPKDSLYVGVKYHIRADYDRSRVELHNFRNGYCGMSAIEDDKVNFSYITRSDNLAASGNSIRAMEETILSRNPYLRRYIHEAEFLMKPVVISHVAFDVRSAVAGNMLMVGDAAGSIAPLSGNGMSMALRASRMAAQYTHQYLQGTITRHQMEQSYGHDWNQLFRKRIRRAKLIQALFGRPLLNNASFLLFKAFPFVVDGMSREIHGEQF